MTVDRIKFALGRNSVIVKEKTFKYVRRFIPTYAPKNCWIMINNEEWVWLIDFPKDGKFVHK